MNEIIKNLISVPVTEKGMLAPKVTKAIKDKLIEKMEEFGFELNEGGVLIMQVGVSTNGDPVYFKLQPSVSDKRENAKSKSKPKNEEVNLTSFID